MIIRDATLNIRTEVQNLQRNPETPVETLLATSRPASTSRGLRMLMMRDRLVPQQLWRMRPVIRRPDRGGRLACNLSLRKERLMAFWCSKATAELCLAKNHHYCGKRSRRRSQTETSESY